MPFFIARFALCRTWLDVSMNRNLKKSNRVGLAGIFGSFLTFSPVRGTYMKPTPSRYFRVSICASTSATVGYFSGFIWSHAGSPVFGRFNWAIMCDSRASARASESMRLAASGPPRLSRKVFRSISMEPPKPVIPISLPDKTVDPALSCVNLGCRMNLAELGFGRTASLGFLLLVCHSCDENRTARSGCPTNSVMSGPRLGLAGDERACRLRRKSRCTARGLLAEEQIRRRRWEAVRWELRELRFQAFRQNAAFCNC